MVLRQNLQNKYSYVYRKATCMQKRSFYLKQNKMAKTHSCSNLVPVTVTSPCFYIGGIVAVHFSKMAATMTGTSIWAASTEFVSSSIPS